MFLYSLPSNRHVFSQVSLRISHNIGSGSIGRKPMYILNLERLAAIALRYQTQEFICVLE